MAKNNEISILLRLEPHNMKMHQNSEKSGSGDSMLRLIHSSDNHQITPNDIFFNSGMPINNNQIVSYAMIKR